MTTADNIIINNILNTVAGRKATDIHFVVGDRPFLRVKGKLISLEEEKIINPEIMESIINFFVAEKKLEILQQKNELKFVYNWLNKARFRVHVFKQKGYHSVALKLINPQIKALDELGLPKIVQSFIQFNKGLIFITGPFNSGRSSTLNSIIQTINQTKQKHILYLEEPIEHLFVNDKSIIEQREVGTDVESFAGGLSSIKEEDVDVVAVSRADDAETLELLLELAESGRLVIAILDHFSAPTAFDAIISEFSDAKVQWARNVLAEFLIGIIIQRLVLTIDNDMILAAGVLTSTPSAQSLIKDGKFEQLQSIVQTSRAEGMVSLDKSLVDLATKGRITSEQVLKNAIMPEKISR